MTNERLISHEEQLRVATEYHRTGERRLEDILVRSQMRLVIKLAREFHPRRQDLDDLVQEGNLGLVCAVRRFDPRRGVTLSTYARWWIRAYQLRWLIGNHRLVRLGTTIEQRRVFFAARSVRARLETAGVEVTPAVLARALGVDGEVVAETLRRMDGGDVSLDLPNATLTDEAEPADERASANQRRELIGRETTRFMASLRAREREVFAARWLTRDPPTFRELGERFGVTRQRVRQVEARLLARLRDRLPVDLAA